MHALAAIETAGLACMQHAVLVWQHAKKSCGEACLVRPAALKRSW